MPWGAFSHPQRSRLVFPASLPNFDFSLELPDHPLQLRGRLRLIFGPKVGKRPLYRPRIGQPAAHFLPMFNRRH